MTRADAIVAVLALVCGLALGACFGSDCIDPSTLDYSLSDARYTASTFAIGAYEVDDDALEVGLDPVAQTVTLTFTEDGRPIEIVYDIVRVDTPE